MIKCVFFDIDGTLLSFKTHRMSDSTKTALLALQKKGIKLFISTGRSPCSFPNLTEITEFGFDGFVMLNGQYCMVDEKVIHNIWLKEATLAKALSYMKEKNISCEFLELDYIYANFINERLTHLRKIVGNTAPLPEVAEAERFREHNTYQFCPYIMPEEEEEFFAHVPDCKGVRWNPLFVDVIPKDGGKSVGMQKLLDYFGYAKEECMAFGDGGNDKEMLRFAGIGVAMGNAALEVQAAADFVTKHVDEDGIAYALSHFKLTE